ncbi:hypothetical protein [Haloarcula terrestris]|nr:hypothetical protein [Haloarcula terrestris]
MTAFETDSLRLDNFDGKDDSTEQIDIAHELLAAAPDLREVDADE